MMEFGKSLRNARAAKGYTIAQIAEATHMLPSIVEGLENEDFSRIAAPIYGRSFVRLYCEAVGLESKPFVDEFMEILNGNHATSIKERPIASDEPVPDEEPAEEPLVAATPAVLQPAKAPEPDLFTAPPAPAVPEPVMPEQSAPATPEAPTVSRYASTFRMKESTTLPVLPWRLIVLGIAAFALIILIVLGIRALYSATTAEPTPAAVKTTGPAAPTATPVARTQQNIPSLYID